MLYIQLHPQAHTPIHAGKTPTNTKQHKELLPATSFSIFRQKTSLNVGLSISNKRITAPTRALAGDTMWWERSTAGFANTTPDKSVFPPSRLTGVLSPRTCLCCQNPASLRLRLHSPPAHRLLSLERGFWLLLSAESLLLWRTKDDLHFHQFNLFQIKWLYMLCVHENMLSHFWFCVTPRTLACSAPLLVGFSRQEYWSGLSFPSPRDLSNARTEPASPAWQADSLPLGHLGSPKIKKNNMCVLSHIQKISSLHQELWKYQWINHKRHRRRWFDPWVGKIPWRRKWQPTLVFLLKKSQGYSLRGRKELDVTGHARTPTHCFGLCRWRSGKESACCCRRYGSIPGSGRSLEGEMANPLQYSCLENPMDRRVWWATVHRVTKEMNTT